MTSAEADRDRLLTEQQELTQQRRQLEDIRSSLERDLARLEAKSEGLLKQLQDKDEVSQTL
jgi:chromosome segregation ATPase